MAVTPSLTLTPSAIQLTPRLTLEKATTSSMQIVTLNGKFYLISLICSKPGEKDHHLATDSEHWKNIASEVQRVFHATPKLNGISDFTIKESSISYEKKGKTCSLESEETPKLATSLKGLTAIIKNPDFVSKDPESPKKAQPLASTQDKATKETSHLRNLISLQKEQLPEESSQFFRDRLAKKHYFYDYGTINSLNTFFADSFIDDPSFLSIKLENNSLVHVFIDTKKNQIFVYHPEGFNLANDEHITIRKVLKKHFPKAAVMCNKKSTVKDNYHPSRELPLFLHQLHASSDKAKNFNDFLKQASSKKAQESASLALATEIYEENLSALEAC